MRKKSVKAIVVSLLTIILLTVSVAGFGVYGARSNTVYTPRDVTLSNSHNGVLVEWEKKLGVKGYYVYRWNDEGKVKIATVTDAEKTKFVDTNVEGGKKYFYSVSAVYKQKESSVSERVGIVRLETPVISSIGNVSGGIRLQWSRCEGAERYTIFRNYGKENIVLCHISADGCSYVDSTAESGKKYNYAVVANTLGIKSAYKYRMSQEYVVAPKVQSAVNSNGFVALSWHGTPGAEKYLVYKRSLNGQWSYLSAVDGKTLSYQDKSVKNAETYVYTVKAMKNGVYSGYDAAGVTANYVSVPSDISIANVNNCLKVSWNAVADASKYRVYRKDSHNKSWKLLGESATAYYSDNTVENGMLYTYTVRAVGNNGGVSSYLSGRSMTALKMPSVWMNCTSDSIVVNWSKMSTATAYRVYKKTSAASAWAYIGTVSGNTGTYLTDKSVQEGKTYIYTVRQVYSGVYGSFNSGISTVFNKAPVISTKLSPSGIALNWNKPSVGNGYVIERMTQSNPVWVPIATVNGLGNLKYADSGAAYGQLNYYRIKVKGSNLVSYAASIYGLDPKKPAVALTYDDGPHPTVTHDILDVLQKYNAKATFFVVGSRINSYKDCIIREAQMGCEIANHTYNHTTLSSASNETIASEIARTNNLVKSLTGKTPVLVRAPGGSINSRSAAATGCPIVHWSVDTLDWQSRNASSVIAKVKANTRDGSIVLMHDLYGSTAAATETIVPWLISQGYQLVTVSELMQLKGIDMQPGEVYTSAY